MVFENEYKAREWFLNYQPIEIKDLPKLMYHDDVDYKPKMGDWILFRHLKPVGSYMIYHDGRTDGILISRPILAMFIEWDVWDMALVMRFIQPFRAWQTKHKYQFKHEDKILDRKFNTLEIEDIEFWTGDIEIIGTWEKQPKFSELKKSLSK